MISLLRLVFKGSKGDRGERGPQGERGAAGLRGHKGDRGQAFDPAAQAIILPVDVVVLSKVRDIKGLYRVRRAMQILSTFWQDQAGIAIRPSVRGDYTVVPGDTHQERHFYVYQGHPPSLYVFMDRERVGEPPVHLGEARKLDNFAIVAGIVNMDSDLAWVMVHELGHLLDLDHLDGSAMSANIDFGGSGLTPDQRTQARAAAYELGGY